ncbi:hypothetical protein 2209_scaffold441_00006 [Bacteriophage sp.]|nr:hypothetical protein 2209_scaffold441_00006 [Bacteriophage sp.]
MCFSSSLASLMTCISGSFSRPKGGRPTLARSYGLECPLLAVVSHLLAFDRDPCAGSVVCGALNDDQAALLRAAGAGQRQLDKQVRDDAGRLRQRDRRVPMPAHSLALEALERGVPDAGDEGDAGQIREGDLEGVGRDVSENRVPQGRDLAGVLCDGIAQIHHGRRCLLCDCDRLLRIGEGTVGRCLRREGDGLVVFVVLLGRVCVRGDVGRHVGGRSDGRHDVDGFLDDGGASGRGDPLGEVAAVAVAVQHLAHIGVRILGIESELSVVEALGRHVIGEDAADADGAVSVYGAFGDVDDRLRADHVGEGAGRLALLEVAVTEDDLGVVDFFARHALRQYDQARGGDVVVDKSRHVYLLSVILLRARRWCRW